MKKCEKQKNPDWIVLGISLGTVIGISTDNLGFWIGMGFLFGAIAGRIISKEASPSE